jgi:hypothetical protein
VALCSAAFAVLLLAACGGGSRLSQDAYRTKLAQVKQEAASAQASVARGLQAKTLAELRGRLDAFAESTQRIGDEVAKLKPPANAEAANTELADGLHETARATRASRSPACTRRERRSATSSTAPSTRRELARSTRPSRG